MSTLLEAAGIGAAVLIAQEDDFYRHVGNVFIKRMYFDFSKGHRTAIGHAHKHDHVTLLANGSLSVTVDGEEKIYRAPAFIDVPAGKHHVLKALEDKTVVYCVHDTHGLEVEDLGTQYVG